MGRSITSSLQCTLLASHLPLAIQHMLNQGGVLRRIVVGINPEMLVGIEGGFKHEGYLPTMDF
jgi:hypothetical protein